MLVNRELWRVTFIEDMDESLSTQSVIQWYQNTREMTARLFSYNPLPEGGGGGESEVEHRMEEERVNRERRRDHSIITTNIN